ncbi:MAG: outer membrane beta-barrel protein [Sphingobacteriaceae bacterium]
MEEPTDRQLITRIKEVFDEYEDDSLDLGWGKFREKYPVKRPRPIVWIWVGSVAAALLVCFSLWFLLIKEFKPQQQIAQHIESQQNKVSEIATPVETPDIQKNSISTSNAIKINVGKAYPVKKKIRKDVLLTDQQITDPKHAINLATTSVAEKDQLQSLSINSQTKDVDLQEKLLNANQIATQASRITPVEKLKTPIAENNSSFLVDGQNNANIQSDKKIHFGVFAGTYLSYAKGSDNQFNVGAGISSDFKLSKNLRLSTGLAILQNTFNYERNIPSATISASGKLQMLSSSVRSVVQTKSYRANLVGLDIPVNLKYEFNRTKNSLFIAAGFSSGTFINESYRYQYGDTPVLGFADAKAEEKIDDKHFDNFNFAKTLNISFGSGYQVGKHNKLFIEPFIKYPLQGIGSENLRFGSGGINLRLNFQPTAK